MRKSYPAIPWGELGMPKWHSLLFSLVVSASVQIQIAGRSVAIREHCCRKCGGRRRFCGGHFPGFRPPSSKHGRICNEGFPISIYRDVICWCGSFHHRLGGHGGADRIHRGLQIQSWPSHEALTEFFNVGANPDLLNTAEHELLMPPVSQQAMRILRPIWFR